MTARPHSPLMPPVVLRVPACNTAIACVQHAVRWFVEQAAMDERKRFAIDLAIEELILTLLRYAFDDGREKGDLEFTIELHATVLRIEAACRALPFDLSMVPEFDVQTETGADDAALSVLLLKHMVDRYQLHNGGKEGVRFNLEWLRPLTHVKQLEDATVPPAAVPGQAPAPIAEIRPLREDEALELARLVYRSYGYSYVSDYLYYPDRIVVRLREGMLHSWVAVSERGELAGHAALMMPHRDAGAAEWSIGVVDPRWRGQGLLRQISLEIIRYAATTPASILFVHSVTNHPHTQKSASELGYEPTALLLGYAPASLQFRHIHDTLAQRETTFIAVRPLKPLPPQPVYLPRHHAASLHRIAEGAGLTLNESAAPDHNTFEETTTFESVIEPAVNVAIVNLRHTGADLRVALARERRRLCLEKVDIIYLNIDLADPAAPHAVAIAEAQGFFLAGLVPMQPWPHTLALQYPNNLEFDYESIHAVGEQAQWLKALVRQEQMRVGE